MQDELAVSMGDCGENFEEQSHARTAVERARRTPAIQRLAFDVFEDEIGSTVVSHARVDQSRDVHVIQPREYLAFLPKTLDTLRIDQCEVEELDRGAAFEAPVVTAGEPHRTGASMTERLF